MNRIIPILILVGVIVIGFIDYLIKLTKINDKLKLTIDYKDKFIEYCNSLFNNNFNQELYNYLTENVNRMQIELGNDGILAYMQDPLKGIAGRDYQVLINALPETYEYYNNRSIQNPIYFERINSQVHTCDDCF